MNVLVTGACGYIGSHAVRCLARAGQRPIALDNFSRGHRESLPDGVPLIELDVRDTERLKRALEQHQIECVMHFAAFAYVGESVTEPNLYYDNNTRGTLSLLQAIDAAKIKRMVFSSTCATYGEPENMPIREDTPQRPINPYGWSKLFCERMLFDYAASKKDFAFAALRYFNVAGCSDDGSVGEDHQPETHLVPVILQAALGKREKITIFGEDYPTPDGTCIRDYIHVEDLVEAHVLVAAALEPGKQLVYNLGIGRGYSVKEIVEAARRVVQRDFRVEIGPRRPGDPPELYADADKIARELGWVAKRTDVEQVIQSAWRWFEKHPHGY
ncbi:MAG TPA: UDP-glucose 4-epimerase GalE [Polyangiaceae bacterium]|jgi:UDP-glucose-4-epimerase GalE|nr:UDP-glucose 4-epimerase GalE [Polyangiaceae bacterium]